MVRKHSFVTENLKWLQSVLLLELDKLLQTTVACLAKDIHDCCLLTVISFLILRCLDLCTPAAANVVLK